MNIYEKMSAITEEITAVAKNLNVGWGKNQYKAVGEADVLAAVKPIEAKHGVYSYPVSRQIIDTSVLTSVKADGSETRQIFMRIEVIYRFVNVEKPEEYIDIITYGDGIDTSVLTSVKADGSETRQIFMRIEVIYRFVNVEKPEEYIDIITYGDGVDAQDKAPGKAMTYADKYALLKAYKIITGEDPDQNYSNDLKGKTKKQNSAKIDGPSEQASSASAQPEVPSSTEIKALGERCRINAIDLNGLLKLYGVKTLDDLNYKQYTNIIKHWEDVIKKFGGKKNE